MEFREKKPVSQYFKICFFVGLKKGRPEKPQHTNFPLPLLPLGPDGVCGACCTAPGHNGGEGGIRTHGRG